MKKNLGLLFIFLVLFIFIPSHTYADDKFNFNITNPSSVSTSENIDFSIALKCDSEAINLEFDLKYDTNLLELINISKKDSWEGNNELKNNGSNSLTFTNKGVTGESNVVSLRFRMKQTKKTYAVVSFEDIKLTVNDNNENTVVPHETVKKEINIKSDDNTLKNIKIDDKLLSGFSSSVFIYRLEVDSLVDSVNISSTLNNSKTSEYVQGFGNRKVSLNYGENEILIKVKSESGKEAIYTIKINRKDDRIANNDLKSVIINGGKIKFDFDKSVLSYALKTYKLDTIEIEATPDDSTSEVEIDKPKNLVIGQNKIKITVTAITGDKKEYNFLIDNTEVPTETRLKNLSIKGFNIGFNSDKYNYMIRYNKSIKQGLKIVKTTISESHYVIVEVIGNSNIKPGSVVKVIVTARDGSNVSEYAIKIERDKRVNFFLMLDAIIGTILIILIGIELSKRKKRKKEEELKKVEEELEKTKEIKL